MPRNKRVILSGRSYHITHRCYNREYRFKFASDRNHYRMRLFEMSQHYDVKVLDYMITSNHVHLLLTSDKPSEISEAMRFLQGSSAQDYNRRKKRSGAFWSGRYHTTLIQDGSHLSKCLFYIGLNMVRTKKVNHPSEWKWCGYHEHIGEVQRYRIIDTDSLLRRLECSSEPIGFREWYIKTINGKIKSEVLEREPYWSEAIAVGDADWIEDINSMLPKGKLSIEKVSSGYNVENEDNGKFQVSEDRASYILKGAKRAQSYITRL